MKVGAIKFLIEIFVESNKIYTDKMSFKWNLYTPEIHASLKHTYFFMLCMDKLEHKSAQLNAV